MALYNSKKTKTENHDDYMTPKSAWTDIQHLIPKKTLWEAFYGDGTSGTYLTELGFNVIHQNVDFFENDLGDIVVSNPPFSMIPPVLERLLLLEKPFILILPTSKINTQYFRGLFKDKGIQLIIPKKRIMFYKMINGKTMDKSSSCNFDCFYYCWKIGLDRDITWL